jgi:AraC family transcriptional regulator
MTKKGSRRSVKVAAMEIKQWLDENSGMSINTTILAREYGVSRNALQIYFKKKYKKPIGQYKLGLRLKAAKEMLKSGKSIKEVAILLSYSSPSSFSNAFRNYYNTTAKLWLQNWKKRNRRRMA